MIIVIPAQGDLGTYEMGLAAAIRDGSPLGITIDNEGTDLDRRRGAFLWRLSSWG